MVRRHIPSFRCAHLQTLSRLVQQQDGTGIRLHGGYHAAQQRVEQLVQIQGREGRVRDFAEGGILPQQAPVLEKQALRLQGLLEGAADLVDVDRLDDVGVSSGVDRPQAGLQRRVPGDHDTGGVRMDGL